MTKQEIQLVYKNHQFYRECNWHKLRALVRFDLKDVQSNAIMREEELEVDISDIWIPNGLATCPSAISDEVLCRALGIVSVKLHKERNLPKGPVQINSMDSGINISALSECTINLCLEEPRSEGSL